MPVEFLPIETCVHCGRKTQNMEGGWASSAEGLPLCHPNADDRPDCYHFVTVYHHPVHDCHRCAQDPWQPMTRAEWHDSFIAAMQRLEAMVQDIAP